MVSLHLCLVRYNIHYTDYRIGRKLLANLFHTVMRQHKQMSWSHNTDTALAIYSLEPREAREELGGIIMRCRTLLGKSESIWSRWMAVESYPFTS